MSLDPVSVTITLPSAVVILILLMILRRRP